MVATDALLLLHVPPTTESTNVIEEPTQTVVGPLIEPLEGNGFTVTDFVTVVVPQELVTVYEIVTEPVELPVTTPVELTEAIEALLEDHVPPVVESNNVIEEPKQTVEAPLIGLTVGNGLMVMARVRTIVPQPLTTV